MSEIVDGLSDKSTWRTVCKVLLAGVSSWACARCLNADAEVVAWICLFALEFIALNRLKPKNLAVRKPLLRVVFLFTLAFAVSLILGDHIVVPASGATTLMLMRAISHPTTFAISPFSRCFFLVSSLCLQLLSSSCRQSVNLSVTVFSSRAWTVWACDGCCCFPPLFF